MALFKILRGSKENLPEKKTDGYCYFTTDTGMFYIDISDNERLALNANDAQTLLGKTVIADITKDSVDIPTSGAVWEAIKDLSAAINTALNTKMDKENPTGTGAFSLNRKNNTTIGKYSFAEGYNTKAQAVYSHTEGYDTSTQEDGRAAHAEGGGTTASGAKSHAEGTGSIASNENAHAEGNASIASGLDAHAEGCGTDAIAAYTHAEGFETTAYAQSAHSEGEFTSASGKYAHSEGYSTAAAGQSTHAEGEGTKALGDYSHAEGYNTTAIGVKSHTEGASTLAVSKNTYNKSNDEIISTWNTYKFSLAKGDASHVEGKDNLALGTIAHAEGLETIANGNASHAEGTGTIADGNNMHVQGKYNETTKGYAHVVGWGASNNDRKDIHRLNTSGDAWYAGKLYSNNSVSAMATNITNGVDKDKNDVPGALRATNLPLSLSSVNLYNAEKQYVVNECCYIDTKDENGREGYSVYKCIKKIDTQGINLDNTEYWENLGEISSAEFLNKKIPAQGYSPKAEGIGSMAIGYNTKAFGEYSFASGNGSIVQGNAAHAEGYQTKAEGNVSHAEGTYTKAYGDNSHAEGTNSETHGADSHAEGTQTTAMADSAHAEGKYTIAYSEASHAEGRGNILFVKINENSHDSVYQIDKIVDNTYLNGNIVYLENGVRTFATITEISSDIITLSKKINIETFPLEAIIYTSGAFNNQAHSEGQNTIATGLNSHSEGQSTRAIGQGAHSEGVRTIASGVASHVEGADTIASGNRSHAEGDHTIASGNRAHAEGNKTRAQGNHSHAEGNSSNKAPSNVDINTVISESNKKPFSIAYGTASHVEGADNLAIGEKSHAEGYDNIAYSEAAHVEGKSNSAFGASSHAEGSTTIASESSSHSEGSYTLAVGYAAHAEGYGDHAPISIKITTDDFNSYISSTPLSSSYIDKILSYNNNFAKIINIDIESQKIFVDQLLSDYVENVPATIYSSGAIGDYSHSEGFQNRAIGSGSHSEGYQTISLGDYSHTEGYNTQSIGNYSHTEGENNATGVYIEITQDELNEAPTITFDAGLELDTSYSKGTVAKYGDDLIYYIAINEPSYAWDIDDWEELKWDSGKLITAAEAAHVEGSYNNAGGLTSHAEGWSTQSLGNYSHSEGYDTEAKATASHSEGYSTTASGKYSHAEGRGTVTSSESGHSEGQYTEASGNSAHAEGLRSKAKGGYSHAEGEETVSKGKGSHTEGYQTETNDAYAHAEGKGSKTSTNAQAAHAEGVGTQANSHGAHSEGRESIAAADSAHAEGKQTKAGYDINNNVVAASYGSHAEGLGSKASKEASHAEGKNTNAHGISAHAEGQETKALANNAHAEGNYSEAVGITSHAEGYSSIAYGTGSHVEGGKNEGFNSYAHVEGAHNKVYARQGHAEGYGNIAGILSAYEHDKAIDEKHKIGDADKPAYSKILASHAEGFNTQSTAQASHSEGIYTKASNTGAHAEGYGIKEIYNYTPITIEGTEIPDNDGNRYYIRSNNQWVYAKPKTTKLDVQYYVRSKSPISKTCGTEASSLGSHAEGVRTQSKSYGTHSEGRETIAAADSAHAEGYMTRAGIDSNEAVYKYSYGAHAEGVRTQALHHGTHAEGREGIALGDASHVEGWYTIAIGNYSHAEGKDNKVGISIEIDPNLDYNLDSTKKYSYQSIVKVNDTYYYNNIPYTMSNFNEESWLPLQYLCDKIKTNDADEQVSVSIYILKSINSDGAHAEGVRTQAINHCAHAEGREGIALGDASHVEGWHTIASSLAAHAEGSNTDARGAAAHSEGYYTISKGLGAHAEGTAYEQIDEDTQEIIKRIQIIGEGKGAHAEGRGTQTQGDGAHAEGDRTRAQGTAAHAEGGETYAHYYCHAEGQKTMAGRGTGTTYAAHAEGIRSSATSIGSHARGFESIASGYYSSAVGNGTIAFKANQFVCGAYNALDCGGFYKGAYNAETTYKVNNIVKFNQALFKCKTTTIGNPPPNSNSALGSNASNDYWEFYNGALDDGNNKYAFIVGNGTSDTARSNAMTVAWDGEVKANTVYGAVWNDYAEYRDQTEIIEPGYCVVSADNGQVSKTTEKFQVCDGIVSDTFGFAIGETDNCKTPLAVAGRVLAYCEGDRLDYHAGDTVCAGPNGKVTKMTREEIREWPDRIVGTVSEIPMYETWGTGNVAVNGRIWIKIK